MIAGQGVVGKLVLLIAEKLLDKKLEFLLDEKKRACRAFVELYFCVDRLEELNGRFVETLGYGVQYGHISLGDLQILLGSLESVSQRFLDTGAELYHTLSLIDPILAVAVRQLYGSKDSFLHMLSNGISYGASQSESIEYMEPTQAILEIDMDSFYDWVKASGGELTWDEDRLEWPQNLLSYSEFDVGFQKATVLLTDAESLGKFRSVLIRHGAVLSDARARLREFIAAKFSLEDILYVSRGMKRDTF